MSNQVIIIGNGFDLACGLKSSYKDFFEWYFYNRLKSNNNEEKEIKNFWFEYFFSTKKPNDSGSYTWTDIETAIKKCINDVSSQYLNYFKVSPEYNSELGKIVRKRLKKSNNETLNKSDVLSLNDFFKILFSDLKQVELKFIKYLKEEISKNQYYRDYSNELIMSLIFTYNQKDWDNPQKPVDSDTKILSFNYTNIFENDLVKNNVINIHGSLKNEDAIFGIDNEDGKNDLTIDFTKKLRILFSKNRYPFLLDKNVQIIKFYGHGLGDADFSHFKYIFDRANLCEGRVELIFFFSEIKGEPIEETRIKMVKKIHNFINKYGSKIGKENLFDILFIESRIAIQELPIDS